MSTSHYTPALLACGRDRIVYQNSTVKYGEKTVQNSKYYRAGYFLLVYVGDVVYVALQQHGRNFGAESEQSKSDRHVFQTVQRAVITATAKALFVDIRNVEAARAVIMHAEDPDVDTPFMLFYISPETLLALRMKQHVYDIVKISTLSDTSPTGLNFNNMPVSVSSHVQRCAPALKKAVEGYHPTRDVELFQAE